LCFFVLSLSFFNTAKVCMIFIVGHRMSEKKLGSIERSLSRINCRVSGR
jgi:hypothetical protein